MLLPMQILSLSIVLTSIAFFVLGQDADCVTPDDGVGICKPLAQCPDLKAKADSYFTSTPEVAEALRNELRQRQCSADNTWKVCCHDCLTPDRKSGIRKHIRNCTHIFQMLGNITPESLTFIRNSRLTTDTMDVCCGPDPTTRSKTSTCDNQITSLPHPSTGCCGVDAHGPPNIAEGTTAAGIHSYPWSVLLEYESNGQIAVICGGALISNRYVVTGAQCVSNLAWTLKSVRVGEYDTENVGRDCITGSHITMCSDGAASVPVESVVLHPQYDSTDPFLNDIALVRLSTPVKYTDFIRPICLPSPSSIGTEGAVRLQIAGWGKMVDKRSKTKQSARLITMNIQDCLLTYGTRASISAQQHICAYDGLGKDTCIGDIGGPLMAAVDPSTPHYELVGLDSFGPQPCGTVPGVPGVYTGVQSYVNWIRQNVRP